MIVRADRSSQGRLLQNRVKHKNMHRLTDKTETGLTEKKAATVAAVAGRVDRPTVEWLANLHSLVKGSKIAICVSTDSAAGSNETGMISRFWSETSLQNKL